MLDAFAAQSKSMGDLLGSGQRSRVIVPTFQRGYSWEKKHVEAFWRDIRTFQSESSSANGPDKYFLGPIVIMQRGKDEIHILDGQQRLATTTILFSVLRDVARSLQTQGGNDLARDIQVQTIVKEDEGPCSLQLGEMDDTFSGTRSNLILLLLRTQWSGPIAKLKTRKKLYLQLSRLP
jgi:hypothetical protein